MPDSRVPRSLDETSGLTGVVPDRAAGLAYLLREGNFKVPCSRYGTDSESCARTTWWAAKHLDDPPTYEDLEYLMGLTVNDHDDIAWLLKR